MSGAVEMHFTAQEAREATGLTRKQAAQVTGYAAKTVEALEYDEDKLKQHHAGVFAKAYGSPELGMLQCVSCDACFPRFPVPEVIEGSLLANAAKQMHEAEQKVAALMELSRVSYGKISGPSLTDRDRQLIAVALSEGADVVQSYRKFLLVLVKRYAYQMDEINRIIQEHLGKKESA